MHQVPADRSPISGGLKPPPGLRVAGLGPVGLGLPPEFANAPWTPEEVGPSMDLVPNGPPSTSLPSGVGMVTPSKRPYWRSHHDPDDDGGPGSQGDSRPPSPPRRLSPRCKVAPPVFSSYSSEGRFATQGAWASGSYPADGRIAGPFGGEASSSTAETIGSSTPGARPTAKSRSQSVPIPVRMPEVQEAGLFGFFEAFGGFFSSQLQGTKCTGPDVLAINERLVEIDLSGEFPPERRAAQVDLMPQMPQRHCIRTYHRDI